MNQTPIETYSDEVEAHIAAATWITDEAGSAHRLFVGHVRRLARRLDADDDQGKPPNAALYSAYLRAISELESRRPGARDPEGGRGVPGQDAIPFEQF